LTRLEKKARESSIKACRETKLKLSQPSYEMGYIRGARENQPNIEEMLKRLQKAGIIINLCGWHDLRKDPDDLPQDVQLNQFESYNPLVLIFFYRYDDHGKAAKVYALDRWSGEPFNKWETFYKDDVIAWRELPKFEG